MATLRRPRRYATRKDPIWEDVELCLCKSNERRGLPGSCCANCNGAIPTEAELRKLVKEYYNDQD